MFELLGICHPLQISATLKLLDESESKEEDEEAKLNAAVRYSNTHMCAILDSNFSARKHQK